MDKGVLATVAVRWVWRRVAACGHRRETEAVAKVKQSPVVSTYNSNAVQP